MSQRFLDALHANRVLLMDGAMGTELLRAGLPKGDSAVRWNLDHPDGVCAVHKAYVDAGADVLVSNTFQAHPAALAAADVPAATGTVVAEALRLARLACTSRQFVLIGIGPFHEPGSRTVLDPAILRSFGPALHDADGILFETWSDPLCLELPAALRREAPALEGQAMLLSLAFRRICDARGNTDYRSLDGRHTPQWFAREVRGRGFAALGVNCGIDMSVADSAEVLRRYRQEADLPVFARPNAGNPSRQTPAERLAGLQALLAAGPRMLGGCCGTSPADIAAIRAALGGA